MEDGFFGAELDASGEVLVVTGEVDEEAAPAFRSALESGLTAETGLTVDLSRVTYLPSAAIGVLVVAMRRASESGQSLELLASSGTIAQRVLEVCALPHRSV